MQCVRKFQLWTLKTYYTTNKLHSITDTTIAQTTETFSCIVKTSKVFSLKTSWQLADDHLELVENRANRPLAVAIDST